MNACAVFGCLLAASWSVPFGAWLCDWHYVEAFERDLGITVKLPGMPAARRGDPVDAKRRR